MVNDTDPSVAYSGQWYHSKDRDFGDYRADVHWTKNDGQSATATWTGTGIDVVTETNRDEGMVDVYVDGQLKASVDAYSSSRRAQHVLYTIDDLPHGVHTLTLTKRGGIYLIVDRFNYR